MVNSSLNLSDLNGINGFTINGISSFDFSGWSVSSAGDVNSDGITDLIIGAWQAKPNGNYLGQLSIFN
ncbi:integrin alpha [Nostoc sp.]|uniref:integrin alpha n=1 Tax=Nostoc sp. TaxID=1180 RepID=UPI002FF82782